MRRVKHLIHHLLRLGLIAAVSLSFTATASHSHDSAEENCVVCHVGNLGEGVTPAPQAALVVSNQPNERFPTLEGEVFTRATAQQARAPPIR